MLGDDHSGRPRPHGYGWVPGAEPSARDASQPPAVTAPDLPRDTDVLCVPAHPGIGVGGDGLELRRLPSGEVVALAFRSPERLVAQLGDYQPWVGLPAIALAALVQAAGVRRVLVDPILDPDIRRWGAREIAEVLEEGQS